MPKSHRTLEQTRPIPMYHTRITDRSTVASNAPRSPTRPYASGPGAATNMFLHKQKNQPPVAAVQCRTTALQHSLSLSFYASPA